VAHYRTDGVAADRGFLGCSQYRRVVSCLHESLQAPVRRGEERFSLNEPIWIFAASGALCTGRIKDISLSGVAIVADRDRVLTSGVGEHVRIFITEVGFVAATVVRQSGCFLAVRLDLPACIERDLLIRKLFTAGLDATTVDASAFSSLGAMLMSIWSTKRKDTRVESPAAAAMIPDKLPAQSLMILAQPATRRLADLAAKRSIAA
jgi:cellulose synthase (UDP-forming)